MFNTDLALEVTLLPKGMNPKHPSVDIKTERREASSGAESRQREGKVAFVSNCLSVEASDLLAYQKYQLRISKPHCLIK